jgi:hypothetical protein
LGSAEDGLRFTGDSKDNKNYGAYGADVLAVADATVAEWTEFRKYSGEDSSAVQLPMMQNSEII